MPVHEGEAGDPEDDGADAEVEPVLEEDVDGVLGAHGAGLHEGEAALHEEDDGGEREAEEVVQFHGFHLVRARACEEGKEGTRNDGGCGG